VRGSFSSVVMATVFPSLLPLLFLARVCGLSVAFLVLFWALAFKSSFLNTPNSLPQQDLIYAVRTYITSIFFIPFLFTSKPCISFIQLQVLHPVLMVIGFILLSGEGSTLVLATQKYYVLGLGYCT